MEIYRSASYGNLAVAAAAPSYEARCTGIAASRRVRSLARSFAPWYIYTAAFASAAKSKGAPRVRVRRRMAEVSWGGRDEARPCERDSAAPEEDGATRPRLERGATERDPDRTNPRRWRRAAGGERRVVCGRRQGAREPGRTRERDGARAAQRGVREGRSRDRGERSSAGEREEERGGGREREGRGADEGSRVAAVAARRAKGGASSAATGRGERGEVGRSRSLARCAVRSRRLPSPGLSRSPLCVPR